MMKVIPRSERRGGVPVVALAVGGTFLFFVAAVSVFVLTNLNAWRTDASVAKANDYFEDKMIPEDEKQEMQRANELLGEAVLRGDVSFQDAAKLLDDKISETPSRGASPLYMLAERVHGLSGLTEVQYEEARLALNRLINGILSRKLDWTDVVEVEDRGYEREEERTLTPLPDSELTPRKVRKLTSVAKELADNHGLPEDYVEIDLSDSYIRYVEHVTGYRVGE
ncbi:MAG: hypothetical protein AAGB34_04540 [Planctomycetota bacterium]